MSSKAQSSDEADYSAENWSPEQALPEFFNIGRACCSPKVKGFDPSSIAIMVETLGAQTSSGGGREPSTTEALNYDELNQGANRFARALHSLGLAKGDRVMLWLPNCLAFPVAFFGALKAGLIAVPASAMLTADELDYLATDSGARVLVTTPELWAKMNAQPFSHHCLEALVLVGDTEEMTSHEGALVHDFEGLLSAQSDADVYIETRAQDPAYLVYTSGTTGFPKGVLHAHRALIGRLPASRAWFDYQPGGDRILHAGKFNWTYVLGTALMDPLFQGKSVVVYEGESEASAWPRLIAKHQCSIFIGVPTQYRQIIEKTGFSAEDLPSLRYCMSAGEHLSDDILQAWHARFGLNIYEAIGMSECSYYLSQHASRAIRAGSAGVPQPGHQVHLLNEDLQPTLEGQEGMLCIGLEDPGLFLEYWRLPAETAASRRGGYFLTGDYAHQDDEGYFWFHGRRDDIINSFGYRISPHEIERVLKGHPHVADCIALGEALTEAKNLVVACVIAKPAITLLYDDLLAFAAEHLAAYKVPRKIYLMDSFPRTNNGKVLRKQLRARLPDLT